MPTVKRPAALIFNPMAGGQKGRGQAQNIATLLEKNGFEVAPLATTGPGDATRLAREVVDSGQAETVFALGGDGTLREVAKGLLGSDVVLGPLPAGTANVLARALGLPLDARKVAAAAGDLVPRALDVGLAADEPFLMMVSCGLDGRVLERQNPRFKKLLGRSAIALQGLQEWWRYDYPEIRLRADGEDLSATFAAICNIPLFGGEFRLAPDARPDDRLLDLVLFQGRGRLATLGFAAAVARGRHLQRGDVEVRSVAEVEVLGISTAGMQLDGDVFRSESFPLSVRLAHQQLRVLAPPSRP